MHDQVKGVFRSAGYMSTCLVENVRKPGLTMVLKCDPKVDALLQEYRMCQRVSDIPGTVRVREWIYLTQKSDVCVSERACAYLFWSVTVTFSSACSGTTRHPMRGHCYGVPQGNFWISALGADWNRCCAA